MIPRTIYLLTVDEGDYHKQPVTIRAYASNSYDSPLQKLVRKLDRYYAAKPNLNEAENPDWWEQLTAWQEKHPISGMGGYYERSDFKIHSIKLLR